MYIPEKYKTLKVCLTAVMNDSASYVWADVPYKIEATVRKLFDKKVEPELLPDPDFAGKTPDDDDGGKAELTDEHH
jgi:hypothetical protein